MEEIPDLEMDDLKAALHYAARKLNHPVEEFASLVHRRVTPKPMRNIMELEGLGKEIWQGIDAQEYVNQERDSWNG